MVEWTGRAADAGADLIVFPEMMLTGYPVEDLALRDSFVDASIATLEATAQQLEADGLGGIARGHRIPGPATAGDPGSGARQLRPERGRAAYGGTVAVATAKHHLPNYGVFDEYRYFVPGNRLPVVRVPARGSARGPDGRSLDGGSPDGGSLDGDPGEAVDVAIAICEDLWQDGGPVAVTRQAGAGLLVVPNASPYERGKDQARLELVAPAGPRGWRVAGVREHDGRPGRAGLRRGFDHRRC